MKVILHIIIVGLLTLLTQVGGLIWILNFGLYKWLKLEKSRTFRLLSFLGVYLLACLFIVPTIAKFTGRVPLPMSKSNNLIPHNYLTVVLNRHYVKPKLRHQLMTISDKMHAKNSKLKVSYLDANFPFIDGFPLLPHKSHNDGRKVDLSFYYTKDKQVGNLKPSNSGYGKFVAPLKYELNHMKTCLSHGYWQYDYPKYLTFGSRNDLEFDAKHTKLLLIEIAKSPLTRKILLEPNLKERMNLKYNKIRFQGCSSVRHDDHIHYEI